MRTTRMAAVVGVLGLLVGACGGGSDDGASSGGSGAADKTDRQVTVDPVKVATTVDAAATAKATIGPAGGKVAAAGADGTSYELVVPAGALTAPVEISVAPITEMAGLPDGSELTSGVQMEPDGLLFLSPSWLYIDAGGGVEVGAGLSVDDDVASLRPVGFDGERYVLPVAHFSGAGTLGPGTFSGWDNRMPPSPAGQSLQGSALDLGGPVDVPPGFPGTDGGMTPPGPGGPGGAAGGDDAGSSGGSTSNGSLTDGWENGGGQADAGSQFDEEIGEWADEAANAQLTGDEEGEARADKKREEINEKIRGKVDELAEACYREKDATKLVDIVKLQIRGQFLGFDDDDAEKEHQEAVRTACGRFEMKADGKMMFDAPPVWKIGDSISVTVPLELEGLAHQGSAEGKVEPVGYDRGVEMLDVLGQGFGALIGVNVPNDIGQNDSMNCSTTPARSTLDALAAGMFLDDGPQVVVSFQNTDATVSCPAPVGSFPLPPFVTDLEGMRDMGIAEATDAGLNLEKWERPESGKPWAKKHVGQTLSESGMTVTLTWDFTITHEPAPPPKRK